MLRVTVAVTLAITMLFVGLTAISESAQQAQPALDSTSANESYDLATGVFGGAMQGGAEAIVWFGIAAIVLVALGLLVSAGRSGGR